MKDLIKKHSLLLPVAIYGVIYMSWFALLERKVQAPVHIIHSFIDDYIPFIEIFVVPYFLWFAFVAFFGIYFYFKDRDDFKKLAINLAFGMTAFLIISTLFPNGHNLRLEVFPRNNIFTDMVKHLYTIDTPTNILPSIHVYNTLCIYHAVRNSDLFKNRRIWRGFTSLLSWSIIASTVFLKQHSIIDVILAFALELPMYMLLYKGLSLKQRSIKRKSQIETL
ncbi:MAG: phosphoesterase [Clostridiaceae bacterium]